MAEILEVAAVAVPDPVRGEEVKVYVCLRPGHHKEDVPPSRIMEFSQERLARFKLPRYIEYVDSLPKTASGKIAKPDLRGTGKDLRRLQLRLRRASLALTGRQRRPAG